MTPEDLIDELRKKVVLAPDEAELEAALDDLQSALQEHRDYLESVAADYLLSLPLAIRKRLSKLTKRSRFELPRFPSTAALGH
jgi:hypothetical protein